MGKDIVRRYFRESVVSQSLSDIESSIEEISILLTLKTDL